MTGSVKKYGPTWRIRWDAGMRPDGKRNIRASTRRAYEGHIRVHLIPYIGGLPLTALRADHLDAMYAAIRNGEGRTPSAATIRRVHATLRTALNSAVKRRYISYNPAMQVELDPEPVRERDVWTAQQVANFLAHAASDRLGPAFHLIANTGMRRGECCGLRWADIDFDRKTVTIRQQLTQSGKAREFGEPKTKRGARVLHLDDETLALLRSHRAAAAQERLAYGPSYNDLDLVFCREDGSPLAPEQVSRRFLALSEAAGLPRIVLHGLRHTYATNALAAGVAVPVVSKRLGHAKSAFTADTYMRLPEAVDQEAAELVAAMFRKAGEGRREGSP